MPAKSPASKKPDGKPSKKTAAPAGSRSAKPAEDEAAAKAAKPKVKAPVEVVSLIDKPVKKKRVAEPQPEPVAPPPEPA